MTELWFGDKSSGFGYSVVRSKRRSFSVTVKGDNSVVVRCPLRASDKQVMGFISEKSDWIARVILKNSQKISQFTEVLSFKKILIKGRLLPVTFGKIDRIDADAAFFKSKSHIKSTLISSLKDDFMSVYEEVCRQTSLKASGVYFRDYKARWGCCDLAGKIVFNYKLLMLDESLWRYVILHELCHTVYMNHSVEFYSLISNFMPEYKLYRSRLKGYSLIASLSI